MLPKWSLSKWLVLLGSLLMLSGLISLLVVLHVQHECLVQEGAVFGEDVSGAEAVCSYGAPLGLSYLILAMGAGVIVMGALAGSPRRRSRVATGMLHND
jgi:hypothetical protein